MKFTVTAGHSNADPGNTAGGIREADLMDELGHLVAQNLRMAGHEVRQDGELGENWPLPKAIALIQNADLAVELHTNAVAHASARGVEVVAMPSRKRQAMLIAEAIGKVLEIPQRHTGGWYDANDHRRARDWNLPAAFVRHGGLIVEVFFQSNPHELARYLVRREDVARAIAAAMLAATGAQA